MSGSNKDKSYTEEVAGRKLLANFLNILQRPARTYPVVIILHKSRYICLIKNFLAYPVYSVHLEASFFLRFSGGHGVEGAIAIPAFSEKYFQENFEEGREYPTSEINT